MLSYKPKWKYQYDEINKIETYKDLFNRINNDINEIKKVVRETVEEVLSENGLLVEGESKSSDMFKFRVGQHLFEGKVMKVKKMSR